jgi:iron complex outermembrane receptor protein
VLFKLKAFFIFYYGIFFTWTKLIFMRIKINNLLSKCLLLALMLGFSSYAMAQRTITGTVTDDRGDAVISATVQVKGTTIGTTTDLDGKYSINVPEGSDALLFSYIGYATQEVALSASNVIDLEMSDDVALIDEVVVIGYGTQTRKEVTSAVTSVKSEDFNQGNVQDPIQLVQGKVAGLSITTPGGDPNGSSTIRLRGLSSFGANTQPLIVIDGVIGGTLNSVDPNDIESIDVLKDGSAAAIYGTRASAGVILITTKKGRAGKTTVTYNGYITNETVDRTISTTDATEFRSLNPSITADDRGASTNWLDEVTRPGLTHVHNVSLSGGMGKTTYRASFNYRDAQGVMLGSGFQQLNGRLNLSQKALNDKLTFNLTVAATDKDASFGFTESLRYATLYNPTAPVNFDANNINSDTWGGYYQAVNFDYFNPAAIANQGTNLGNLKTLLISGKANYNIMDGLDVAAFVSRQKQNNVYGQFYRNDAYFRGVGGNGLANRSSEDITSNLFELTANYNKEIGSSSFSLLAGYSFNENFYENFGIEAGDFITNDLGFDAIGTAQDIPNGLATVYGGKNSNRVIGFFGRLNYNMDDTYFLSASIRREGSSRFGTGNKWGNFPAASAGVTLSNLFDAEAVDNLKLRVGYGVTGSLPGQSYLSQLRFGTNSAFYYNGGYVPAYSPAQNSNPDLRWETKGEFNAGIDFALLNYKLTGTFDYYNRVTSDLLYNVAVDASTNQADRTWANLDDVELQNAGVELTLSYNMESDDKSFTWSPTLTFGTYNTVLNKVEAPEGSQYVFFSSDAPAFDFETSPGAPGLNNDPMIAVIAGQPVGQIWGLTYEGVDDNGNFIFADIDGDGTVDASPGNSPDKSVIGNGLPSFSLGFANGFTYNDFDLSFFLRGDFGHDLANMYRTFYEPNTNSRTMENIVKTDYYDQNLTAASQFSSHYVEDASYMVLDNLTVGYRFTAPEGSGVTAARIYLTGRNLLWVTNYTGADPQPRYNDTGATDNGNSSFRNDPLAPGIDRRSQYFTTRSITFGLNLDF